MVKLKLNGKKYSVKSVSELTFNEYNRVIIKAKALDLPEYLAVMTGILPEKIMNAKLDGASLPAIYNTLLDVQDHNAVVKTKKHTVEFRGEIISMDSIELDTVGKSYLFSTVCSSKKLNDFEKSVYALAVGLADKLDMEEVRGIYQELIQINWRNVLPQGFFLLKKQTKGRLESLVLSLNCTVRLKKIQRKTQIYLKRLRKSERI